MPGGPLPANSVDCFDNGQPAIKKILNADPGGQGSTKRPLWWVRVPDAISHDVLVRLKANLKRRGRRLVFTVLWWFLMFPNHCRFETTMSGATLYTRLIEYYNSLINNATYGGSISSASLWCYPEARYFIVYFKDYVNKYIITFMYLNQAILRRSLSMLIRPHVICWAMSDTNYIE